MRRERQEAMSEVMVPLPATIPTDLTTLKASVEYATTNNITQLKLQIID